MPYEYGALQKLQVLAVNGNMNLSPGRIPTHYGNLVNLKVLQLSSLPLVESIPSEIGNLINLGTSYEPVMSIFIARNASCST